jgi:hypothetical protein
MKKQARTKKKAKTPPSARARKAQPKKRVLGRYRVQIVEIDPDWWSADPVQDQDAVA